MVDPSAGAITALLPHSLFEYSAPITQAVWSPDGSMVALVYLGGALVTWTGDKWSIIEIAAPHSDIGLVGWSPDQSLFAVNLDPGKLLILDGHTFEQLRLGEAMGRIPLGWSADGKVIYTHSFVAIGGSVPGIAAQDSSDFHVLRRLENP